MSEAAATIQTDWQDLRHFATLAKEGSLSAAARRLKVDHATVARRVAGLEAALGLKLVDRRARAYILTAEGRRIAAIAARMETIAFELDRAASGAQAGLAGPVTVSAPPTLAATLIAPRLGALYAAHPGISMKLIGEKRSASLSRREADVAVRLSRPTEKSLVARRVGRLDFALFAARAYLGARAPADFGFIAYDDTMDEAPQQKWLRAVAGTRRIVLRASDLDVQRAAAKAGLGIAALPRFFGEADPALERLDLGGRGVSREIWLAVHRDLRRVPLVRASLDFLAACFDTLR
jgi:DNA-binding transcriptional LysR family regulator